jgi:hypothetical protein
MHSLTLEMTVTIAKVDGRVHLQENFAKSPHLGRRAASLGTTPTLNLVQSIFMNTKQQRQKAKAKAETHERF